MKSDETARQKLFWATWTSPQEGLVVLTQDWTARRLPPLSWGPDRLPLRQLRRASRHAFGKRSGFFIRAGEINFIVPDNLFDDWTFKPKALYLGTSLNGWSKAVGEQKWELTKKPHADGMLWKLTLPEDDLPLADGFQFKFVTESGYWLPIPTSAPNVEVDAKGNRNYAFMPQRTGKHLFTFTTPEPFSRGRTTPIIWNERGRTEQAILEPGVFLKTLETDLPLGALVEAHRTTFRLFAPQAYSVQLRLRENLEDEGRLYPLHRRDDVAWEVVVPGERDGWFYDYFIAGSPDDRFGAFDPSFPVVDPYARAVVSAEGPGIVLDPARLPRPKEPFTPPSWHDLVICEAHVRDLIRQAPLEMSAEERRGFTGLKKFIEDDSFYISELGVNAIELQPIQAFDAKTTEEYHWGYMTTNYFSPAPQYALAPEEASQLQEFAEVVEALHARKLAVIVDVVYNHVGEPNFLGFIDKAYHFLLGKDGHYMNYSGCGNTLDCDAPMVRRLMRDSLVAMIEMFDIDGFRFDLGELIGKNALHWLELELKKVKPSILLVCEPWSFRGHIAHELKETGVGSWNDGYREFMRKYLISDGSAEGMRYFMSGSPEVARFPAQTVNYVESHDDRCWIDKITENRDYNGTHPTPNDRRRTHLMIAMLMASVGLPMINSGTDFLKSKGGVNNTYQRGDLNALPYARRHYFAGTHRYFREWIQLRLSPLGRLFRLDASPTESFFAHTIERRALTLRFNADQSLGPSQAVFAVNPHFEAVEMAWPGDDFAQFTQIADHERVMPQGLESARFTCQNGRLTIPSQSCGLWVL